MDALDRFYQRLLQVRHHLGRDRDGQPITIAEIYQQMVPYRLVRGELGFSELKEYEHALLRLLAGERGYVRVGVPNVADEFRRELRSPNPIPGIYRDYAAVEVELPEPGTAVPSEPLVPVDDSGPGASAPVAAADGPALSAADGSGASSSMWKAETVESAACEPTPGDLSTQALHCWSCHEPLPTDVAVRFCPQCGLIQVAAPCVECATPLQPSWKFCVQCGTGRSGRPSPPPAN